MLTAEELIAGGALTQDIVVPPELSGDAATATVRLRPLTVRDLQRITKAVKDDETMSATFMIQHALIDPELTHDQVLRMPAGLASFLVDRINDISGIDTPRDALAELVQAPLAKACFVLAKEFGWTPEEVSGMTIGQILLYLEMSHDRQGQADAAS
jgi:hypothetical protein